jgi:hypothetical protein
MTSELMNMISPKRLHKVVGMAVRTDRNIIHVEQGMLFAATSTEDAVEQAKEFFLADMGFDTFTGYAKLIDRVDGYKVILVDDSQV